MLHIVGKVEIFKELVDVVLTVVEEVKIVFTPEGVRIRTVDPAHIAMIDLSLGKDAFDVYEVEEIEIGINISKFAKVIGLAEAGTDITLRVLEDTNEVVITFGHIERKMVLIDTSNLTEPKMPDLKLPATVTVQAHEVRQAIKISMDITDYISISVDAEKFILQNSGDTGSAKLELPKDKLEELECEDPIQSMFALDYFSKMIRSIKKSELVKMHLGNAYPIKVEFTIADQNGMVIYLLAPRIES